MQTFTELLRLATKHEDFFTLRNLVEQEYRRANARFLNLGRPRRGALSSAELPWLQSRSYRDEVGLLLDWLNNRNRPFGISDSDLLRFRPICENFIARKQLLVSAFEVFDQQSPSTKPRPPVQLVQNQNQPRVQAEPMIKTPKIHGIARHKGEVALDNQRNEQHGELHTRAHAPRRRVP